MKPHDKFNLNFDEHGLAVIHAENKLDINYGIGYAHAYDRLMQTLLMRVVVNGQLTEYFADTDEAFAIDFLVRKMNLKASAHAEYEQLSELALTCLESYTKGFNACFNKKGRPFICKMLGYQPEPWSVYDCLAILKLQTYLGMAQIQENTERLLIQSIKNNVSIAKLKQLYSPHLDGLTDDLVEQIKATTLAKPFVENNNDFLKNINVISSTAVSNNWALMANKTNSKKTYLCFDPHLQINRLPNFWYECIAKFANNYRVGITVPGLPFLIMGRTAKLAGGFTYGLMDTIDFFMETCRDGKVLRDNQLQQLQQRTEVLNRKKHGKVTLTFYESDIGVIETGTEETAKLNDGNYFALAWASQNTGIAASINAFVSLWEAETVTQAQKIASNIKLPCNWLFTDNEGNIGYQQSGALPKRNHSGLYPLPAHETKNHWMGEVQPKQLSCDYNPEKGYLATANQDVNQAGKPLSVNIPYAAYRYNRICELLEAKETFNIEDMREIQADVFSLQAKKYLQLICDYFPNHTITIQLKNWDCRYTIQSKEAVIFEAFYFALLNEIAGKQLFGEKLWQTLITKTSILAFIHANLDKIILADDENWFVEDSKKNIIKRALESVTKNFQFNEKSTLGEQQTLTLTNIFFDGKLPKFFGFDKGPYSLAGSRATISLIDQLHEGERLMIGGSSYRFITDMQSDRVFTVLIGGPSEKRFSKRYAMEVPKWLKHQYKEIQIKVNYDESNDK